MDDDDDMMKKKRREIYCLQKKPKNPKKPKKPIKTFFLMENEKDINIYSYYV